MLGKITAETPQIGPAGKKSDKITDGPETSTIIRRNFDGVAVSRTILARINRGERNRADFSTPWGVKIKFPKKTGAPAWQKHVPVATSPQEDTPAISTGVPIETSTKTAADSQNPRFLPKNCRPADYGPVLSNTQKSQLSILVKIINRGTLTLLSPELEAQILRLFRDKTGEKPATLQALQLAHRIQILALFLRRSFLFYLSDTKTAKQFQKLANLAVSDLRNLDRAIAELYDLPPLLREVQVKITKKPPADAENKEISVEPAEPASTGTTQIDLCQTGAELKCDGNPEKPVKFLLNYLFGFPDFRTGQINSIIRTLRGEDTIALLPTGSGKSIIFQMLALIRPGLGLVIAPIVSLIYDQADNLQRQGVDRVAGITAGSDDKSETLAKIERGGLFLLYIAPERLQIASFQEKLKNYAKNRNFAVVAIDEAHCVSEWGHDFRTSYLNLAKICRELAPSSPLLALTGTASARTLSEMCTDLKISPSAVKRPKNFDRPEIHFDVVSVKTKEKPLALRRILTELLPRKFGLAPSEFYRLNREQTLSGIIFCPHVSGDFGVLQVKKLAQTLGLSVTEYYGNQGGGQRRGGGKWAAEKQENASRFKDNLVPLLVATKSFGMGVDKPNIRYTIHYCPPASIEAYYQEVGRGGRDGGTTWSFTIISNDHEKRNQKLLNPNLSYADLKRQLTGKGNLTTSVLKKLRQRAQEKLEKTLQIEFEPEVSDDVDRLFFFHFKGFPGEEAEFEAVKTVLEQIIATAQAEKQYQNGNFHTTEVVQVKPALGQESNFEKSLYLLEKADFVRKYTANFASGEYEVHLSKPPPEDAKGRPANCNHRNKDPAVPPLPPVGAIQNRLKTAIRKIYTEIEPGRRLAIGKIIRIMTEAGRLPEEADRDNYLRKEVLAYLTGKD